LQYLEKNKNWKNIYKYIQPYKKNNIY
jgi:hypothetical protein